MTSAAPVPSPVGRHRRWVRARRVVLVVVVGLVVAAAGAVALIARGLAGDLEREDVFGGIAADERPAQEPTEALDLLVLGSDGREGAGEAYETGDSADVAGERADTTLLVHISADRAFVDFAGFRERQKQVIASMLDRALSRQLLVRPDRLVGFLAAATRNRRVDDDLDLRELAASLRAIDLSKVALATVPLDPEPGPEFQEGGELYGRVAWDEPLARALYADLRAARPPAAACR